MINLILLGILMMIWSGIIFYQLNHFIPYTREDYEQDMAIAFVIGFYLFMIGII